MKVRKIKFPAFKITFWDKAIELLGLAALILLWVMTYNFQHLGAKLMPEDYSFFQNPSEYWASKMTYTIPVIATILFLGISIYNTRTKYADYPIEDTPEKAKKLSLINQRLWRWLKFMLILMFIMIEYFSFHSGSGFGTGIPKLYIILFPLMLFAPVIFFFIEFSQNQLD
ncbi:hypothetical protein [Fontibacter flavus]|uniref:DUF1648 domain-containing protein n=1 Tax=Fontibacter flavus TaxID=654838 RepID=A0ABV6FRP2_9BACT|nr:hypothetical protein [Cyclobacteriaceae bacterium]